MTEPLAHFRHIVGVRPRRSLEIDDTDALTRMFDFPLPAAVVEFVSSLSDCLLYYAYQATTKTGKPKPYGPFVLPFVGPGAMETLYQPASLIGYLKLFREQGLGREWLPFAMVLSKNEFVFCDVRPDSGHPVVFPKRDVGFDGKWPTVVADSFEAFVEGLQLDLKPLLRDFRLAGTEAVRPPMSDWFVAVLGPDWKSKLDAML